MRQQIDGDEKESVNRDTIWIVDDHSSVHAAIGALFKDYALRSFYSGEEFCSFLEAGEFRYPDLIILDIIMEKISGFQVIDRLMKIMEFREIPIIVLSTNVDIDDKVKALEMGATDYVVKPVAPKELSARARVHIKIKKNQDALREKVILDFLTNTFNKRHLYTKLKKQLNLYDRHRTPFSILFFDIDHFKELNDGHSHLTGDYVLKELCMELKERIRNEDELFRYGGEEFVIISPYCGKDSVSKFAEKIRLSVMNKTFLYREKEIKITISVGVATIPDDNVYDEEALLALADQRMLDAKKSGRNRVVCE